MSKAGAFQSEQGGRASSIGSSSLQLVGFIKSISLDRAGQPFLIHVKRVEHPLRTIAPGGETQQITLSITEGFDRQKFMTLESYRVWLVSGVAVHRKGLTKYTLDS